MNAHSRAHTTPMGQRGVINQLVKTLPLREILHAPNFIVKVGKGEMPSLTKQVKTQ